MTTNRKLLAGKIAAVVSVIPLLLFAYETGPDPRKTGAPGDSTCAEAGCHTGTAVNAGPGSIRINFASGTNYVPGVKQRISVTLSDPTQRRWGFQLSARPASNTRNGQAGTFTTVDNTTQIVCEDGTNRTPTGSCRSAAPLEFIEHTTIGTRAGTANSSTWEFDWTPPATNIGNVMFYAAGNAANNNQQNTGDRVYTASATLTPSASGPAPSISANGVVNGGSFQAGIASNTWITILGTNLATASRTWDADVKNNQLPTSLDGTSVTVNGKPAYIAFISPTQVNALAPPDTASGPVTVELSLNGQKSSSTAQMAAFSPSFFIFNPQGNKYIASRHADFSLLGSTTLFPGATTPAKPGEVILLYGTGFGPTNPAAPSGQVVTAVSFATNPVTVRIGGAPADVSFIGLIPGASGLFQINVKVPDSTANGDAAVEAEIGGIKTQGNAFITVQR